MAIKNSPLLRTWTSFKDASKEPEGVGDIKEGDEDEEDDDETPLTTESLFKGIENRMNRHPSPAVGFNRAGSRSPYRHVR